MYKRPSDNLFCKQFLHVPRTTYVHIVRRSRRVTNRCPYESPTCRKDVVHVHRKNNSNSLVRQTVGKKRNKIVVLFCFLISDFRRTRFSLLFGFRLLSCVDVVLITIELPDNIWCYTIPPLLYNHSF